MYLCIVKTKNVIKNEKNNISINNSFMKKNIFACLDRRHALVCMLQKI